MDCIVELAIKSTKRSVLKGLSNQIMLKPLNNQKNVFLLVHNWVPDELTIDQEKLVKPVAVEVENRVGLLYFLGNCR
jgi:hypothetical protein